MEGGKFESTYITLTYRPFFPRDQGVQNPSPLLSQDPIILAASPRPSASAGPGSQGLQHPLGQKSRSPVPSSFRGPLPQAPSPSDQRRGSQSLFPGRLRSRALKVSPAHLDPKFARAQPGDSRACGRGPSHDWAVPELQFKKSRGDPTQDRGPGGGSAGKQRGWRSAEAGGLGPHNPHRGISEVMEGRGGEARSAPKSGAGGRTLEALRDGARASRVSGEASS